MISQVRLGSLDIVLSNNRKTRKHLSWRIQPDHDYQKINFGAGEMIPGLRVSTVLAENQSLVLGTCAG